MKLTEKEYSYLTKKISPDTKYYKTLPTAFVIGGLICALVQILLDRTKLMQPEDVTEVILFALTSSPKLQIHDIYFESSARF